MQRGLINFGLAVFATVGCALAITLAGCQEQAGPPAPVTQTSPTPAAAPVTRPAPVQASAVPPVPTAALTHRAGLIRNARAVWGLEAPIAAFAAQIHQESAWNPRAVSHVGAAGLAQFMPGTSKWISGLYPELAGDQPFNPAWAMRAMVTYDRWLYDRAPAHYSAFDKLWVALRSYNGGLGHWQQEARNAAGQDRASVDAACGTAKRARSHCKENLGYPHRILVVLQPRYAGWGNSV